MSGVSAEDSALCWTPRPRGPVAPPRPFRSLECPRAQGAPSECRSTEPTDIPVVPSRSTWAALATINGIIQSDGFLSRGHRNAWSQWEGEGPAGCVFINQPPCPCGGQQGSARVGYRPWAPAPTERRLVWAGAGPPAWPVSGRNGAAAQLGLRPRPSPCHGGVGWLQRHF